MTGNESTAARARWEILYERLAGLESEELLSYAEMGRLLGVDATDPSGRQTVLAAARRAVSHMERADRRVCQLVRGKGYRLATAEAIIEMAKGHQSKAVAHVEKGYTKVDTIDLDRLDPTTRRVVEATAFAFAQQTVALRQLDVRQERLEHAMAAVVSQTAENAAQMEQLRRRLTEVEARQGAAPAPPASFLPPSRR